MCSPLLGARDLILGAAGGGLAWCFRPGRGLQNLFSRAEWQRPGEGRAGRRPTALDRPVDAEWGLDSGASSPALAMAPCPQGGGRAGRGSRLPRDQPHSACASRPGPSARGAALAVRGPLSRQEPHASTCPPRAAPVLAGGQRTPVVLQRALRRCPWDPRRLPVQLCRTWRCVCRQSPSDAPLDPPRPLSLPVLMSWALG